MVRRAILACALLLAPVSAFLSGAQLSSFPRTRDGAARLIKAAVQESIEFEGRNSDIPDGARLADRGFLEAAPPFSSISRSDRQVKGAHEVAWRAFSFAVIGGVIHRRAAAAPMWDEPADAFLSAARGAALLNGVFLYGTASRSDGTSNWAVPIMTPVFPCPKVLIVLATNPHGSWARGALISGLQHYAISIAQTAADKASHMLLLDVVGGHHGVNRLRNVPGKGGWESWEADFPVPGAARMDEMYEQTFRWLLWSFGVYLQFVAKRLRFAVESASAYAGRFEATFRAGLREYILKRVAQLQEPASKKLKV